MIAEAGDFPSELLAVALSLGLDRAAAIAVEHLRSAGIASILLKGAAIATWLYDEGEVRPYRDVDLLVSPAQLEAAKAALADLGYWERLAGADPSEFGLKEQELFGPDGVCIDLHHGLIGVSASGERCWDLLAGHTMPFSLGGGSHVQILDVPARTMHLALHVAQNGPVDRKALADLERGVARVGIADWRHAAALAEALGADEAFAAGLRLLPAGEVLADQLLLTRGMSVELAIRARSAPQGAIFLETVADAPSIGRKAALVARKLFPTTAYLHAESTSAGRSHFRLVRAWTSHLGGILRRLGPSLAAWHRARVDTGAHQPDL